jgi:hypothetical protein
MSRIVIEYGTCNIELNPIRDESTNEIAMDNSVVSSQVTVQYRTDDLVNAFVMAVRTLGEKNTDAGELMKIAEQLSKEPGRRT